MMIATYIRNCIVIPVSSISRNQVMKLPPEKIMYRLKAKSRRIEMVNGLLVYMGYLKGFEIEKTKQTTMY